MSAVDLPRGVTQDAAFDFFEKNLTTEFVAFLSGCSTSLGSISRT